MADLDSILQEVNNLKDSLDSSSQMTDTEILIPEKKWYHVGDWLTRQDDLLEAILKAVQDLKYTPPEQTTESPTYPVPTPPPSVPTPEPQPSQPIPPDVGAKLDMLINMANRGNLMTERVKNLSYWGLSQGKDWAWLSDTLTNRVIAPRTKEMLWQRTDEMGWIISSIVSTDNPELIYTLKLDHALWSTSIYNAWVLGLRDLGFSGVNVVQYDTIVGVYSIYYVPYTPGDPYKAVSWIEVENPTDSPITIYYGELNRIILKEL